MLLSVVAQANLAGKRPRLRADALQG